jgi:hypothetical protein
MYTGRILVAVPGRVYTHLQLAKLLVNVKVCQRDWGLSTLGAIPLLGKLVAISVVS